MTKTMTTTYEHPDREKCLQYLSDYGTPPHVVGHCIAVAETACRIGRALNEKGGTKAPAIEHVEFETFDSGRGFPGYRTDRSTLACEDNRNDSDGMRQFDLELTLAAGLLHDMARVEERHWDAAADFCLEQGLTEEAKIIRVHMQYEFIQDAMLLTEADLVCLSDRLVLEDRYVGIDERMDYIIAKAERSGNMDAKPIILRKKEETKVLLRQIEERIGMSLDELMGA
ncbi:MAG: HD domain-containing protein [Firmicutes bacterium]|nr:HD domain-containing protein [Bacillota bacterium]